ncbi:hypothetical protein [Pandoraea sputorum]|uniref:hypothetical protein n=1 Tax=Pandoraea sputorum TaxID=93222 RepID=UPI001240B83D|nr:hypothetical protein [Pandoraea sputorum]
MTDETKNIREPGRRTCRYGHGDLAVDMDGENPALWYLTGFRPVSTKSSDDEKEAPTTVIEETSVVYTLQIYVCPTCGYTELFDDGKVYG